MFFFIHFLLTKISIFFFFIHSDLIYNISEKTYNYEPFGKNRIREYPFEDHHPPSLKLCFKILQDVYEWLKSDPINVAIVHCR